jgi:hypothetical protein
MSLKVWTISNDWGENFINGPDNDMFNVPPCERTEVVEKAEYDKLRVALEVARGWFGIDPDWKGSVPEFERDLAIVEEALDASTPSN